MSETVYPYRIFLSYSHEDYELICRIEACLREIGYQPIWDKDIHPGTVFSDAIRDLIGRSHVFMPILTANSQKRPWVHQETGYARALNLPIVPIAFGKDLPSEMIAQLQAVSVQEDLSDFMIKIRAVNLERLVAPIPRKPEATVEIAEWTESRTDLLVKYASWVEELGVNGFVRYQDTYTSLSLPDVDIDAQIWRERDGSRVRSDYLHHLQREERQVFHRLANKWGCRLILNPESVLDLPEPQKHATRLIILMETLHQLPSDLVEIAFTLNTQMSNLLFVGDYFCAESIARRTSGLVHTVFNSHAPTVLQRARKFDEQFHQLCGDSPLTREQAINRLNNIIKILHERTDI